MGSELVFTPGERRLLMEARRAVLATIAPDGAARLVPICFAVHANDPIIWTPLDDKPKAIEDPRGLARARDILADPRVTVLVDRWSEVWSRLAWLRCVGLASLVEPPGTDSGEGIEHTMAVEALRARYEQYADHDLARRPIIEIVVHRVSSWGEL